MPSVVIPANEKLKAELKRFSWVNWSEIAREEVRKKDIFERYMKTKKISAEDAKFCEEIDWHPVDELPLREEYIKKLERIRKGPTRKMTLKELHKLTGLKK
jgi:hypothetical protein